VKPRVLFVDDEPNILSGLRRMLSGMRAEWEMAFCEGAEEGLRALEAAPFDVVVSDMRMPGMNGAQFLREVQRLYPATVRIVLSGHADRSLVDQCIGVAHQYISKPCEAEQLKVLIRNATRIGDLKVDDHVKRLIGSIDQLPSAPEIYLALRKVLQDEESSFEDIGRIIGRDMAMTAQILKLVNSSFFGLRRTIETPQEAVAFLGVETVKGLVLVNGVFEHAQPFALKGLSLGDLWEHSLLTSAGAKAICALEGLKAAQREEAFVGGLLHDLGMLLFANRLPEGYQRVLEMVASEKISVTLAEQWEFGIGHPEMGAYLLGLWALPSAILEIVSGHHHPPDPEGGRFTPLHAVHAADVFAAEVSQVDAFRVVRMEPWLAQRLEAEGRMGPWREAFLGGRDA